MNANIYKVGTYYKIYQQSSTRSLLEISKSLKVKQIITIFHLFM